MQTTKQLPKWLRLLRGPKRSYAFMVKEMEECCTENPSCSENPNCENNKECKQLFDNRCIEWRLNRQRTAKSYRQPTDIERYSTWLPTLHLKEILQTIRVNSVY